MPLKELHAAVPQEQSMVLSDDPSTFVQGSPFEQVLVEEEQINPVVLVHSTLPHVHATVFAAEPSRMEHTFEKIVVEH